MSESINVEQAFLQAQQEIKKLTKKPDDYSLLKLYALFKQASVGDVGGSRPGLLNMVARAKYDAWAALSGKSTEAAQQEYIELVSALQKKFA